MGTTDRRYTTWGPVRNGCGHRHKSVRAALACAEQDDRWCRRVGGYSDRSVCGVGQPLTEAEEEELHAEHLRIGAA